MKGQKWRAKRGIGADFRNSFYSLHLKSLRLENRAGTVGVTNNLQHYLRLGESSILVEFDFGRRLGRSFLAGFHILLHNLRWIACCLVSGCTKTLEGRGPPHFVVEVITDPASTRHADFSGIHMLSQNGL
ncbi:hypothetical protein Y032_0046g1359 [Ancylostoma ceylanicum]|nr:hypothetical protein Y032_0046g1359 [Ancylostoma ceylanicum]